MRLLLDTHAMYWYVEGDPQLSAAARTLIQDASQDRKKLIQLVPFSFFPFSYS